jgi:hypothetical protein
MLVPATPTVALDEPFRTLPVIVAAVSVPAPPPIDGAVGAFPLLLPQADRPKAAETNITPRSLCIDPPLRASE